MVSNPSKMGSPFRAPGYDLASEIPTCKMKGPDGYLYHPVWIHPSDAEKRGIKYGDVVNVFNERGSTLHGAFVTERIIPGAVSSDHGAKYDPIVPGVLDRGGRTIPSQPHNILSQKCCRNGYQRFPG